MPRGNDLSIEEKAKIRGGTYNYATHCKPPVFRTYFEGNAGIVFNLFVDLFLLVALGTMTNDLLYRKKYVSSSLNAVFEPGTHFICKILGIPGIVQAKWVLGSNTV